MTDSHMPKTYYSDKVYEYNKNRIIRLIIVNLDTNIPNCIHMLHRNIINIQLCTNNRIIDIFIAQIIIMIFLLKYISFITN